MESIIPSDDRDAGGLPNVLHLFNGTRIMLLRNLFTQFGLVNKAVGVNTHVSFENYPYFVYVKFGNLNLPASFVSRNGSVLILAYKQEFISCGQFIIRVTFPLVPCKASTIHKVQGLSLERTAIHIGSEIFNKVQAYVALL